MEKDSKYYDSTYTSKELYAFDYKNSPYFTMWSQVIYLLRKQKNVQLLEMGCGAGQFANYLFHEGFNSYVGFDFSTEAIQMARKNNPKFNFFVGDVYDSSLYKKIDFEVAICLEVLEHLDKDKSVIKSLPFGREIIISIPDFDMESHVRWFRSFRQVKSRYYRLINITSIVKVSHWYVLKGTREDFNPNLFQKIFKTREEVGIQSFIKRIKFRMKNFIK